MRVLFINQYFPPDVSASAYLLAELAEDLSRDHEIHVLAGRPSYNPAEGLEPPRSVALRRVWSTSFPRSTMPGRIINYLTFFASSQLRALGGPPPDIVVAFTDPPVIGLVGLIAARRHRAPFVYVCQDIFPDVGQALGVVRSPFVGVVWKRLNRILRGGADIVVAIGRDMEEKLRREGAPASKIRLLRNWGDGVPLDAARREELRSEMGWSDHFVVMHAGNLGLAQKPSVIIDAAGRLDPLDPSARIVFLGDGASRERLEARARERELANVEFLPYVPKDRAQDLMGAADLHVVSLAPDLWGCVAPSKVYGIMAAGRPFVAAVQQGSEPARIAEEHGCGVRVEPDDPDALADAILRMRDEPLEEMGRRGRTAFEERYDRPIATAAYRRLLEEVASSYRGPPGG